MEIKTYNAEQLKTLIQSEQFKQMPVVPISTHRAIAQIENPRAEPEDVLMLIVWQGDSMTGYLGILPDRIYNATGKEFKCGWLSGFWVSPEHRGKGIGKQLLEVAFKEWKNDLITTEFAPGSKALFMGSGHFEDLRIDTGLRCFLRFNLHEILPPKAESYKRLTPFLKLLDTVANIPNAMRLKFTKRSKHNTSLLFEQVTTIDTALDNFISTQQQQSFARRRAVDLNWILSKPWVLQAEATTESKRYQFSALDHRFKNICFKISEREQIVGFLHFTIRNNHLKIPYAYFDKKYTNEIVAYIYKLMFEYRLNMLTVFHSEIVACIGNSNTPFIYKRGAHRHYIISKSLSPDFRNSSALNIQDGDGDCVFT